MTSLADRVPLERINTEARRVDIGRAVLLVIATFFVLIGKSLGSAVNAVAWCAVAVRVGFREVRPRRADVPGR